MIDIFTHTGTNHLINQDYVLAGQQTIIICDGCSSSEYTDVGARLVAHAALANHTKFKTLDNYGIINLADSYRRLLNLPQTCLDATLLQLKYRATGNFTEIKIAGDGIYFWIDLAGNLGFKSISSIQNTPFYLSYQLDLNRENNYQSDFKLTATAMQDLKQGEELICNNEDYKLIGIASDGLHSFVNKLNQQPIPLPQVLLAIVNFKNTSGKFLQRRMKRMLAEYDKQGIYHYDDLTIGIINLQEPANDR